jgi:hypothetical protein
MSDSVQKFYLDESFREKDSEEFLNKEVENILGLYRLLSLEDKLKAKRLIATEKIF